MNNEEIDYWLRYFSNHNHGFMSEDGKKITLFKVFQELKELQQENQSLKKENKILRENAEHNDKVVDKVNWENLKLKKELEENKHKGLYNTCLPYSTGYNKAIKEKENQQKEFIEWLTNEANINPYDISDYIYEDIINTILSKYEDIIDK